MIVSNFSKYLMILPAILFAAPAVAVLPASISVTSISASAPQTAHVFFAGGLNANIGLSSYIINSPEAPGLRGYSIDTYRAFSGSSVFAPSLPYDSLPFAFNGIGNPVSELTARRIGYIANIGLRSGDAVEAAAIAGAIYRIMGATVTSNDPVFQALIDSWASSTQLANETPTAFYSVLPFFQKTPAFVTMAIPEPATWMTLTIGFAFVGAALRRKKQATASV